MKPLTPKQKRFVQEFLIDSNGAAAARRAGYSARTSDRIAERLLRNVEIRKMIDAALAEQSQRTKITADKVLQEVGNIAFAPIDGETGIKVSTKLKALIALMKHFRIADRPIDKKFQELDDLLKW